jgi:hypothetical protein
VSHNKSGAGAHPTTPEAGVVPGTSFLTDKHRSRSGFGVFGQGDAELGAAERGS